ncbi:LOW QUALITY PROTEIN: uncharacterized protein At2g29880-like [Argentina anserina]|uniref:LOW QUALITY PROTEIN: uncharacterized protein At2g29880-like n=1 Tax=Argentina anserina TaxID=57926 RepID=UPI0021766210|nr:LOW QUALITY PROTEIN: uncharacterized protein At2g29880-like [Potentilla anserina]
MGDTQQDVKKKGNYEQWTKEESNALLELMVDGATRGWRDNSGIFTKQTVEEMILPALNNKLGCHKTYNNYQSRLKWFKKCWSAYNTLFRFSSGFGFDSNTKKFTASDEVWEDYIKAHPTYSHFRYGSFPDYEDLELAIGNGVAVGKNSIGLGNNVTDATTLDVGERGDISIDNFEYDVENEVFVRPTQNDPTLRSSSPLGCPEVLEVPKHRRNKNKRGRAEYEGSSSSSGNISQGGIMEQLNKLTTTFEGVYSLLEKRESLLEKREMERGYTTWDVIMEIPNLDEDTCLMAFGLLNTKTKKDGFLKMTSTQRANWIFRKMQEQ